jgi:hypothetical protein
VEYIVFGGAAVNIHGIARFTEDLDFFIAPQPENVVRMKCALRSIWDDPHLDEIGDDDMVGEYPSVQYWPPGEDFKIDLVSRLGEAFKYADLAAEVHEIDGIPVRVATPKTLVRMKRDTVRPKDRIDADLLRRKFGITES